MPGTTASSSWLLPACGQPARLWKHAGPEHSVLPCVQLSACIMAEYEKQISRVRPASAVPCKCALQCKCARTWQTVLLTEQAAGYA